MRAIAASKPMYSPDGRFVPGAVETAYQVLKVFDAGGRRRDRRSVEDLQRRLRREGAGNEVAARSFVRHECPAPLDATSLLPETFVRWFAQRGWKPRAHQLELLAKARAGRSVLLIAPTGAGKTLAGFLPSWWS